MFDPGENRFLFTADTGVPAISRALDCLESFGIAGPSIRYVQIPHHGSKRNLGPAVMNRLFGMPGGVRTTPQNGIVSAPRDGSPKHPSQRVINAALRRGVQMNVTRGSTLCYHSQDLVIRDGWGPATAEGFISFYDEGEE